MHAKLRITLTAAALVATVPAAGIASAHEGHRGGKGSGEAADGRGGKHHGGEPGKRCERRGGKGYEAMGVLAGGSSLEQVDGADTARRGDDRFSGTVIVQVRQGNRRGRQEKGLTSYAVDHVRALGIADGDGALPAVGTRVLLVGNVASAACPAPPAATTPEPTTSPSPSPSPNATASRASFDDDDPSTWDEDDAPDGGDAADRTGGSARGDKPRGDDPAGDDPDAPGSGDDVPASTTPGSSSGPVTASVATIRLIVLGDARRRER